jgi:hypothetical protein
VRTYKTLTGTYNEDDLAVVVWRNPKRNASRSRALETMTSENSSFPMAFPIKSLTRNRSWKAAKTAHSSAEFLTLIQATTRSAPVIVPLPVAKLALGWEDFYIPSEYTEES